MTKEADDCITFGKRLAYTRHKKGLTQKQLAEIIGVKPPTVSCWELDIRCPDVSMVQKIIKDLEVPDDWFENGDNFKNQDIKPIKKLTDFGKRLAYTRHKKWLTQKQLAELVGVKPSTVSCWELYINQPNVSMIQKIVKALKIPENWFENDDNFKAQDIQPVKKFTDFGEHLTYTRKKKGLTGKQLAELIGVKPNTVSCWAMGRRPSVLMIQKIIKVLEVPEDWFENEDNFKAQDIQPVKKLTDFGKRLAYTRKKKGLMQKQLAELIGVGSNTVSCWELDIRYPNEPMIQKIIKALKVPDNWFENDDNFKSQDVKPVKKLTDFGKRLAYSRKEKGLMQKQLAELIGVKPSTVGCWECSVHYPNVPMIQKTIKALELPEDWFENDDNFKAQDIQPVKKLTKEQQKLVIDNEYIIYCVLKKYNLTPFKDEMWDVGQIGLCKAAQRWHKKKGVSFFTVAFYYIKWELNTEGRNEIKNLLPKMSLDQPINKDKGENELSSLIPSPDDEFEQLEYKILLESVYQKVEHYLSPKEKVAFKLWLRGKRNSEVSKVMDVCPQTASEFVLSAKSKCRTYFNADEIFT